MARRNDTDWGSIIGGIAQLAIAGGVAIAVYNAREKFIDELLNASTEDSVQHLLHSISDMDEETWDLLSQGLQARAEQNSYAYHLFKFAHDVHDICTAIDQMLDKPTFHAKMIVEGTAQEMDDVTWNIFTYVMGVRSQSSMVARMLFAHAENARNAPILAEALFRESLHAALADNVITAREAIELENLRQHLQISPDTAHRLLNNVRQEQSVKNHALLQL